MTADPVAVTVAVSGALIAAYLVADVVGRLVYSMLRTIEDAWGLPELAFTSDHAQVSAMNEFLGH